MMDITEFKTIKDFIAYLVLELMDFQKNHDKNLFQSSIIKTIENIANFKENSLQFKTDLQSKLIDSIEAGLKIFKWIGHFQVQDIQITDEDCLQIKELLIKAYSPKIFLDLFRTVCDNLTLMFLRHKRYHSSRVLFLLGCHSFSVENEHDETKFFSDLGIDLQFTNLKSAARIKNELMYLMELSSACHHDAAKYKPSPAIIKSDAIFDDLLEKFDVDIVSYPVAELIENAEEGDFIFKFILNKLKTMKNIYRELDVSDENFKNSEFNQQGKLCYMYWMGMNYKHKGKFVKTSEQHQFLEKYFMFCCEINTQMKSIEKNYLAKLSMDQKIIYMLVFEMIFFSLFLIK